MDQMMVFRLGVLLMVVCYNQSFAQMMDVPYGTEWIKGHEKGCPKLPKYKEECSSEDKRCYSHGSGDIKPCWHICPPQDADPIGQKCDVDCQAYVDNYCVWLNDVPTYTTTSRSHTKAATSRIQTASPRKEVPFGVYALLGVTVVVIGIVICFAIYRNAKCCNNKDSWNPDAERLLVTSPSGATAASSSSAAATPDHPLPNFGGAHIEHMNIQIGDNSTQNNQQKPPASSGDASGAHSDQKTSAQLPSGPENQPAPAEQPPAPSGAVGNDDNDPPHKMSNADELTTAPVVDMPSRPLQESGQAVQAMGDALPQLDSNPPDLAGGN